MSEAIIVWGAAEGGRREHAYLNYPDDPWPIDLPKSVCNNARSPHLKIVSAEGAPRCGRCAAIAPQGIKSIRATAPAGAQPVPDAASERP